MSKRGRRLRPSSVEQRSEAGTIEGGNTRREYDPHYHRVSYAEDDWNGKIARTYNPETIAHYAITRKPISTGDGHLPQPVVRETSGTQLAVEALLRGATRQFSPPDDLPAHFLAPARIALDTLQPLEEEIPPWLRNRGTITFIE